jgi:hypothetical protein
MCISVKALEGVNTYHKEINVIYRLRVNYLNSQLEPTLVRAYYVFISYSMTLKQNLGRDVRNKDMSAILPA